MLTKFLIIKKCLKSGLISALLSLIPLLGTVAFYVGTNILLPYMIFAILTFYRDLDENKSIY